MTQYRRTPSVRDPSGGAAPGISRGERRSRGRLDAPAAGGYRAAGASGRGYDDGYGARDRRQSSRDSGSYRQSRYDDGYDTGAYRQGRYDDDYDTRSYRRGDYDDGYDSDSYRQGDDDGSRSGYAKGGPRSLREVPGWLKGQLKRRPRPLWTLITAHVLALGIALVLYALPHHVIPRQSASVGIKSSRDSVRAMAVQATATPAPTAAAVEGPTAEPTATPEPTPEPEPVGSFRRKFADHFTSGEVERTETSYRSQNLDVRLTEQVDEATGARYYVADIYIADISCLRAGLGRDTYGSGYVEWPTDIAKRYGSIVTVNGDYYGARQGGVVVRNAELLRDEKNMFDVCAVYWDGTMRCFDPWAFNAETEMAAGCYQAWDFGPMLLDGAGNALTSFNSSVNGKNPRSVLGYFEPGHYCFVAVDGRGESPGIEMIELARLMSSLGCMQAYNLDGGQTSQLCAGSRVVNNPYKGGRKTSDVIMILDQVQE